MSQKLPSEDLKPFIDRVVTQNVERHYVRTKQVPSPEEEKDLYDTMHRLCGQFYDAGFQNYHLLKKISMKKNIWLAVIKRIFRKKQSTK